LEQVVSRLHTPVPGPFPSGDAAAAALGRVELARALEAACALALAERPDAPAIAARDVAARFAEALGPEFAAARARQRSSLLAELCRWAAERMADGGDARAGDFAATLLARIRDAQPAIGYRLLHASLTRASPRSLEARRAAARVAYARMLRARAGADAGVDGDDDEAALLTAVARDVRLGARESPDLMAEAAGELLRAFPALLATRPEAAEGTLARLDSAAALDLETAVALGEVPLFRDVRDAERMLAPALAWDTLTHALLWRCLLRYATSGLAAETPAALALRMLRALTQALAGGGGVGGSGSTESEDVEGKESADQGDDELERRARASGAAASEAWSGMMELLATVAPRAGDAEASTCFEELLALPTELVSHHWVAAVIVRWLVAAAEGEALDECVDIMARQIGAAPDQFVATQRVLRCLAALLLTDRAPATSLRARVVARVRAHADLCARLGALRGEDIGGEEHAQLLGRLQRELGTKLQEELLRGPWRAKRPDPQEADHA
jgi:hypothetical protein